MSRPMSKALLGVMLIALIGATAAAQDSESEVPAPVATPAVAGDSEVATEALEECFSVPAVMDMTVLSDQHVYIRTRGGNHYLMTTEQCDNLERSYNRREVRFVPYGRTVCQNDGSYLVYESAGRELPCPILLVERVDDRDEARSIAKGDRPPVVIEEVTPIE